MDTLSNQNTLEWPRKNPDVERLQLQQAASEPSEQVLALVALMLDKGMPEVSLPEPGTSWPDSLLTDWPKAFPRPKHVQVWQPGIRAKERRATSDAYTKNICQNTEFDGMEQQYTTIVEYERWLADHYILSEGATAMLDNLLYDSERGGSKNIRFLSVKPDWEDQARNAIVRGFEQDYLGLEPLTPNHTEEDEEYQRDGDDLRIHEDGLYAREDFAEDGKYHWQRHGGDVSTAAIAAKMRVEPSELLQMIDNYARHPEYNYRGAKPVAKWTLLRMDQYLVKIMPDKTDPSIVTVGMVKELTEFGAYIMDQFLSAYEAGVQTSEDYPKKKKGL